MDKDIKLNKVVDAVKTELISKYGFKCSGAPGGFTNYKHDVPTQYVFKTEIPTGMAAFSWKNVTVSIIFWWFDDHTDFKAIDISIQYEHHGSGSNGYSRTYQVYEKKGIFTSEIDAEIILIDREIIGLFLIEEAKRHKEVDKEDEV